MKVLFLTDGPQNPAARFRCEQFFTQFERAGIQCVERYSYGTHYNSFISTRLSMPYRLAARARRAAWTVASPGFDLIFFQRTALPVTSAPERLRALLGTPTVFDFDDAIYLAGTGEPDRLRAAAFHSAVKTSTWVIAGNPHLASVAAVPEKTTVLPTVVDVERLVPRTPSGTGGLVIGWMGTASNFVHLRTVVADVLAAIDAVPGTTFRIVSNARLPELDGVRGVEWVKWTAERELEHLQSFDVGIMPLIDSEIARGKCAFKILQYLAVGAAVVASAVGANVDVLANSGAGVLLPPGTSWTAGLVELLRDAERRRRMGRTGRELVTQKYSVATTAPAYIDLFRRLTHAST